MLKLLLFFSFIAFAPLSEDVDIKTVNEYKKKAEMAFSKKDYVAAANYYTTLLDSFGIEEPELRLNLAHSYYNASQNDLAVKAYQQISATNNKEVNSLANKQLGAMSLDNKKYEDALKYFKEALKNKPSDHDNQYNYELVKKLLKEQKEQKDQKKNQDKKDEQKKDQKDQQKKDQQNQEQKDQQQKDPQKKDQENQEKKEGGDQKKDEKKEQEKKENEQKDGEKKDEKKEDLKKSDKSEDEKNKEKDKKNAQQKQQERLQKINMSSAKAKMILDAMKNNETKYYQQLKRKSAKKKDRSKPDW